MATTKSTSVRNYDFSDGVLEQLTDSIANDLTRDLATLAARGISAATITNLETLLDIFSNAPTDTEGRGWVTVAVEEKDAARDAALLEARALRTAAQNKFGEGTGMYNLFGFEKMDRLAEKQLPRAFKNMHRLGVQVQPQLESEGITVAFLADFLTAITAYDDKLDAVDVAEQKRDLLTEERITKGNTLYKEIVRLTNIGKDVFKPVSEAKYNDYVIENYTGGGSGDNILATFQGFVAANMRVNLGVVPEGSVSARMKALDGGPIECGISIDGLNFDGDTFTINPGSEKMELIADFNSNGNTFVVRNQNDSSPAEYKIEFIGK